jgi:hypothetical protein
MAMAIAQSVRDMQISCLLGWKTGSLVCRLSARPVSRYRCTAYDVAAPLKILTKAIVNSKGLIEFQVQWSDRYIGIHTGY